MGPAAIPIMIGLTAVSVGASAYEQSKGAAAQAQAADLERQRNDLMIAQKQRDTIRQADIMRGNAVQASANQGAALSSAAIGGQGSITTQMGENLSFLDTYGRLSDQASVDMSKAQGDYSIARDFTDAGNFLEKHEGQFNSWFNPGK